MSIEIVPFRGEKKTALTYGKNSYKAMIEVHRKKASTASKFGDDKSAEKITKEQKN